MVGLDYRWARLPKLPSSLSDRMIMAWHRLAASHGTFLQPRMVQPHSLAWHSLAARMEHPRSLAWYSLTASKPRMDQPHSLAWYSLAWTSLTASHGTASQPRMERPHSLAWHRFSWKSLASVCLRLSQCGNDFTSIDQ